MSGYCEIDKLKNTDNQIYSLFANQNDVYFISGDSDKLYHVNLKTKNTELLFKSDGVLIFNYYNNKLFIGVSESEKDNGMYCIDLKNNNKCKLTSNSITQVYILDNEWIYFFDEFERVYRVSNDGEILEKVFG